jgi:ABC-type Zn uptake system ZnuABC Zn-binding protein ZnuA
VRQAHSISTWSGPAPTYMRMMRHNVEAIVAALK